MTDLATTLGIAVAAIVIAAAVQRARRRRHLRRAAMAVARWTPIDDPDASLPIPIRDLTLVRVGHSGRIRAAFVADEVDSAFVVDYAFETGFAERRKTHPFYVFGCLAPAATCFLLTSPDPLFAHAAMRPPFHQRKASERFWVCDDPTWLEERWSVFEAWLDEHRSNGTTWEAREGLVAGWRPQSAATTDFSADLDAARSLAALLSR